MSETSPRAGRGKAQAQSKPISPTDEAAVPAGEPETQIAPVAAVEPTAAADPTVQTSTEAREEPEQEEVRRVPADEQRFTREQVLADSFHLIGQPPFVLAGVLSENDAESFTKPELRELSEAFLNREVA